MKILWTLSLGKCNNPNCKQRLIDLPTQQLIGEMAHIIAKNPDGPRGSELINNNNLYDNLLLLCPTCHTKIDKDPASYPIELLKTWKTQTEKEYSDFENQKSLSSLEELKEIVNNILLENKTCFTELGPRSDTAQHYPGSNLYKAWELRKLETIIPNNKKLINLIEKNISMLDIEGKTLFYLFKEHAIAFEKHQYDPLERYPLFPIKFQEYFYHE